MSASPALIRSAPAAAPSIGTGGVFIAGVALVVSASTFVTDFNGFLRLGGGFVAALLLGFCIVLPVALATADLAVTHPRAGGIYRFTRAVWRGDGGRFAALVIGLCFLGTFLMGAAGETMAGARALGTLTGMDVPGFWLVPGLIVPAVAANLCGLRCATWITAALLVLMLGVRWWFGLAGFAGWAETGAWEANNLVPAGGWRWSGPGGILAAGLAFGFWAFVGMEGVSGLVEETHRPRRTLPRGMVLGLGAILLTTVVMGIGVTGTLDPATWNRFTTDGAADSPHLLVGHAMFGRAGEIVMAAASVAASASTLLMALAAVPRMLAGMARDGVLFGRLSERIGRVDGRGGAPVAATVLVAVLLVAMTLLRDAVVECLSAAAYLWFLRYLVLLGLAGINRVRAPRKAGVFSQAALLSLVVAGVVLVGVSWYAGFAGAHAHHGARALCIVGGALVCAIAGWLTREAGAADDDAERVADHARALVDRPVRGAVVAFDLAAATGKASGVIPRLERASDCDPVERAAA